MRFEPKRPEAEDRHDAMSTQKKIAEGVPLAMLYKREFKKSPDLVMLANPRSIPAERFRRLKTRIIHEFDARVIVVTSGIPGEGKSTVAINLALAFASEGVEKTLLIDADLRRPSIGPRLDPSPQLGLAEVLDDEAELNHAVLHIKDTSLDVLPAGESSRTDPAQLLASDVARRLFDGFREAYDRVVIDSPPIIPFTDADVVGKLSDGVLLVTRSGMTPKSAYPQLISSVTSTRILGTVLNGATATQVGGRSAYDKYYDSYYEKQRSK
jgi:capsular exopolysaccharide synthesis family protein